MSRFSGPQGRGAARRARERRRAEADARADACAQATAADAAIAALCMWPWKEPYENRDAARAALRRMKRSRKGQGLHEFPCPAGHWHLGRWLRRSIRAWKADP